jgi:GDP-L-fucose synthase
MISKKDKVFIAGHNGMVGASNIRCLKYKKYKNLITASKQYLD